MSFCLVRSKNMSDFSDQDRFVAADGFMIDEILVDGYSDMEIQSMLNGKHKFVSKGLCLGRICLIDTLSGKAIAVLKKSAALKLAIDNTK